MRFLLPVLLLSPFPFSLLLCGADCSQWRKANRDGASAEANLHWNRPADGPPVRWPAQAGNGRLQTVVVMDRACTMGNHHNKDSLLDLDANTGVVIGKRSYPCFQANMNVRARGGSEAPATHRRHSSPDGFTCQHTGGIVCVNLKKNKAALSK